jgi:malate dehydrogenase
MKVTIVGAGAVGASCAEYIAIKDFASEVVIVDIKENYAEGKAMDLMQTASLNGFDTLITGSTNDYSKTADSHIAVITSGIPRKPGMTREELIGINAGIVKSVAKSILEHSPNVIFIVVSNPMDTMAYLTMKVGELPPERVIGQAGILDSARMRAFVAMELGVSVENINCYVLGGHGDDMVPLVRHSNVAGVPLNKMLPPDKLDAIVERTRKGGGEIVSLLKTGSAFYAPGAAVAQMVEAILKDKNLIVPAAAYMQGQYGLKDIFFGVPVQLGRQGAVKIIEYELDDQELAALKNSADAVSQTIAALESLVEL